MAMNPVDIKSRIVEIVQDTQGCKTTDLVVDLALRSRSHQGVLELIGQLRAGPSLVDLIEELVAEGQLVEVTYQLADMPEKTKMFLLPSGTHVYLQTTEELNRLRAQVLEQANEIVRLRLRRGDGA